ncbi:uncharacterized protein LOC130890744 [Diorhabda carinulata]|uniref:uncharacterized protein LOC130890744 n=1 Tax=Diorhabda carinulata TaxID=1163345 RepID=UPI0025A1E9B1|nr:uncharacterized protein LOC130890744 [Diorhabda carinulata]
MNENHIDVNDTINYLETGNYLCDTSITTTKVIKKIYEFCMFFNSIGRVALLNADQNESQELVSLLLHLKKNIKCAISELGQSHTTKKYRLMCPECEELIEVNANTNIWTVFQQHEHFEKLYSNFLNGTYQISNESSTAQIESLLDVSKTSIEDSTYTLETEHTDSGIDYEETCNESCSPEEEEEPLGSNTFRFNFLPSYDSVIEKTLYPRRLKSLNKFNCCKLPTIQKINQCNAICLLCNCSLRAIKAISRNQCLDHIVGQRHMKAANDPLLVAALECYHEIFWNLETCYQAHQVYFEPKNTTTIKCHLCCVDVPIQSTVDHINSDIHKNTVLKLFLKNRVTEFFLLHIQIEAYGIKPEPIKNEKPKVENENESSQRRIRERRGKTITTNQEHVEVKEHTILSRPFECVTFQDCIPQRYKEHSKYLRDRHSYIGCNLCQRNFNKRIEDVLNHLMTPQHWQLADLSKPQYTFYCEICNMKFKDEVSWGRHFLPGQNNHSKVSKSRLDKLTEHECVTCKLVFFGDEISILRHKNVSGNFRKREPKETKLSKEITKMFMSAEAIEKEGDCLVREANNTVTCLKRTFDCCSQIEEVLKISMQYCKAYPFGSRVSGLGNENSDLDLFIDTGNMYFGDKYQDSLSQCEIVKKVHKILNSRRDLFSKIHQVPTARTPIVKLQHIETGLDCDLSFRHGLSVENTKFLRLCLDIQPITQAFILILKKWSSLNNLDEYITTYALAMLAIFYLQVNDYLLSVKELKRLNPNPAPIISGWETIKYTIPLNVLKNHVKQYEHSLSRLLKDFFSYYATFDYQRHTVCPMMGHVINKSLFEEPKQLPPEMSAYVKQLKSKQPEQFRFMSPFCIQDPFDLSHNLTKACQSVTVGAFRKLCELSYKHLDSLK